MTEEQREELPDFYVGTSGYTYPHWRKDAFYPRLVKQADELKHFSGRLPSCEINATYHGLQKTETFRRWAREVQPSFVFALKMHQNVSHKERLKNVEELVDEFCDRARALGPQLGPILVQLPPTFHRNEERLADFLAKLPTDLRFAFEFRSKTWLHEKVFALLRQHNVAVVENVSPDNSCVYTDTQTANFTYVRFHKALIPGETVYNDDALRKHAARFAARRKAGTAQFVYFMNDIGAHGPRNAETLLEMVEKATGRKAVKKWKRTPVVRKGGKGSLQSFFGKAAATAKKPAAPTVPADVPTAAKPKGEHDGTPNGEAEVTGGGVAQSHPTARANDAAVPVTSSSPTATTAATTAAVATAQGKGGARAGEVSNCSPSTVIANGTGPGDVIALDDDDNTDNEDDEERKEGEEKGEPSLTPTATSDSAARGSGGEREAKRAKREPASTSSPKKGSAQGQTTLHAFFQP